MGREIRRVPPNWKHPRRECPHSPWAGGCDEAKSHGGMCYQPMRDMTFEDAANDWKEEFAKWERGERPTYCTDEEDRAMEYWEWNGPPPDREYYRPNWKEGEATWWQAYQTVSEGTPVSPPFETPEELARYLSEYGDFWCQERNKTGMSEAKPTYEQALKFVQSGHALSMAVTDGDNGTVVTGPYQQ